MPERVWEQSLTSEVATAGIQYTLLDDFVILLRRILRKITQPFRPVEPEIHVK